MSSTSTAGTVRVFTFKDGLLSKVAHDLQLTLTRFEVTRDGDALTGRFWPATLTVDGSVKGGRVDPGGLRDKDKRDILNNINTKVLHTDRHPVAQFEGQRDGARVRGTLTLNGRSQPVDFAVREADGRVTGTVSLVPSRWGIAPFKALMGAIKLQDRVEVRLDLPA